MKKTQVVELIANFKRNFVTLFCIVLFVSLGIGAFLGLDWSTDAVSDCFTAYFQKGDLAEFELSYPFGITDSDLYWLGAVYDFDRMEGRYQAYRFVNIADERQQIRLYSVTQDINKFTYIKGQMPRDATEILVEKTFADAHGIVIGDTVAFEMPQTADALIGNRFRVCGIVKSAEYISNFPDTFGINPTNGAAVCGVMYLAKEAFSPDEYGGYASVLVDCDTLEGLPLFCTAYNEKENEIIDRSREKLDSYFHEKYLMLQEYLPKDTPEYRCSLIPKSSNVSYAFADSIIRIFSALRLPFAGLFLLVGAIICYFSVSRNVYDQSQLIGMRMALGFRRKEIMTSLLAFSGTATGIGVILGTVLSRFVVQPVLIKVIQQSYPFDTVCYAFRPVDVVLFAFFEAAIILAATYLAAVSVLKKSANSLLTRADSAAHKQHRYTRAKWFNKLPIFDKTVINNICNETRRSLATVAGVMGITALIVSSVSLYNFVENAFDEQMGCVTTYDTLLHLDAGTDALTVTKQYLNDWELCYAEVMSTYVTINTPDHQRFASKIYVVEDDQAFLSLFNLRLKKETVTDLDGLYFAISFREEYDLVPADTMVLTDLDGQDHTLPIAGFFDYCLLQNQLVITKDVFEKEFGQDYAVNTVLVRRGALSVGEMQTALASVDGFIFADDFYAFSENSFQGYTQVFILVIGVYIFLAILMAGVVIMNLLDMLIKQKKDEIIIMRINGFHACRVKTLIRRDTAILTCAGIVPGVILGTVMGNASLDAYCTAATYFRGGIDPAGVGIGVGTTILLLFFVTAASLKKIDRFRLQDINT